MHSGCSGFVVGYHVAFKVVYSAEKSHVRMYVLRDVPYIHHHIVFIILKHSAGDQSYAWNSDY